MTKKPFLKSGSGTAGGLGRIGMKNRPPVPKLEKQQSQPQDTKGEILNNQTNRAQRTNRESMDEFEQIERTCTNELNE